ncbi:MAG: hypothetical protein PHY93_04000 [Bacteriovorax sp.]|nr:hypothetical protein [Bacteriovorax sp.]
MYILFAPALGFTPLPHEALDSTCSDVGCVLGANQLVKTWLIGNLGRTE